MYSDMGESQNYGEKLDKNKYMLYDSFYIKL